MMISPYVPSAGAAAAAAPPAGKSSDTSGVSDLFLKLLASQLKSQSPLDPVDPTQFVGQLIQFNSLTQLMQIRQLLGGKTPTAAVPVHPVSNASANSIPSANSIQGDR